MAELIDSNRETASLMTQKLSDLYREILESSKNQLSNLDSEISIVQKYLELEGLRFGARLQYKIQIPDDSKSIQIPSLLLQTLVENSVKHGISQSLSVGFVNVEVVPTGGAYFAQNTNTSCGKMSAQKSTGTGLRNTVSRLDLLYGDSHQFRYESDSAQTRVAFLFPGGAK